jgi:hypothetical protein
MFQTKFKRVRIEFISGITRMVLSVDGEGTKAPRSRGLMEKRGHRRYEYKDL